MLVAVNRVAVHCRPAVYTVQRSGTSKPFRRNGRPSPRYRERSVGNVWCFFEPPREPRSVPQERSTASPGLSGALGAFRRNGRCLPGLPGPWEVFRTERTAPAPSSDLAVPPGAFHRNGWYSSEPPREFRSVPQEWSTASPGLPGPLGAFRRNGRPPSGLAGTTEAFRTERPAPSSDLPAPPGAFHRNGWCPFEPPRKLRSVPHGTVGCLSAHLWGSGNAP
jgi:hypothetical protein